MLSRVLDYVVATGLASGIVFLQYLAASTGGGLNWVLFLSGLLLCAVVAAVLPLWGIALLRRKHAKDATQRSESQMATSPWTWLTVGVGSVLGQVAFHTLGGGNTLLLVIMSLFLAMTVGAYIGGPRLRAAAQGE